MRKRAKRVAQRIHAKRRALERFGLALSKADLDAIGKIARSSKGKLVQKQSNRIKVYDLTYKEKRLRVVYDKQRKTPVTFLDVDKPVEWAHYEEKPKPWLEFKRYLYKEVPRVGKRKKKKKVVAKVHLPKRQRQRLRGRLWRSVFPV